MDAQPPGSRAAVLLVQERAGGLVVLDAAGNEHEASTDAELGRAIRKILADPELPQPREVHPQQARLEDVITSHIERRAPELAPYAAPAVAAAVSQVRDALSKVDRGGRTRKKTRPRPKARPKARKPPRPGGGRAA